MEALPFRGMEGRAHRHRGAPELGRERLPNHTSRSRRALLLAGGCCSSLLALAIPTKEPGAAIVVTGIRRSIQDSIAIKRRERGVVEAVSAEEIGKLPDVSIAESIARLPGLAAQRVAG